MSEYRDSGSDGARREKLRYLVYLMFFLGQGARSDYPAPKEQKLNGFRQFRAYNEIYQELARQLLSTIGEGESRRLSIAVNEILPQLAREGGFENSVKWALEKASSFADSQK